MEPKSQDKAGTPRDPKTRERKARERLARPPRDRREVTIGPTTGTGPDVTLG